MDRSIEKGNQSSNPAGVPAGISKMNYLGQVSCICWEDSEFLSVRKVMALCPECALNVSTPVHSSHIHAGSVCVCGWFNVIHRRKHCLHPAGVAGSNPPTPPFSTAFRAFLLAYSTPISLCLNIVRKWRLNHRIHQIPRWPLSGRWELPLMFSSPKFSNPKFHES